MLSKEPSFNRLCTLIRVGDDCEETAAEINDLLNQLYSKYSELEIFRGVASRFSRPGYRGKNRSVIERSASRRHARQRDHQDRVNKLSGCAPQPGEEPVLYCTSPSDNVLEFPRYVERVH